MWIGTTNAIGRTVNTDLIRHWISKVQRASIAHNIRDGYCYGVGRERPHVGQIGNAAIVVWDVIQEDAGVVGIIAAIVGQCCAEGRAGVMDRFDESNAQRSRRNLDQVVGRRRRRWSRRRMDRF
jgi:hypothetical protein